MTSLDDRNDLLRRVASTFQLELDQQALQRFARYAEELQSWNERINLTAVHTPDEIYERHFLDSLSLAPWLGPQAMSLIDIGSGAGFPGLALKIARPELRISLVESIGKKCQFLEHMVQVLELDNVQVIAARAEELGRHPEHRERYSVATGRAVAELRVLAEYLLPLTQIGGRMIAPKGAAAPHELAAAKPAIGQLGGGKPASHPTGLPGRSEGAIIVVAKIKATPSRLPRPVGVPLKKPL